MRASLERRSLIRWAARDPDAGSGGPALGACRTLEIIALDHQGLIRCACAASHAYAVGRILPRQARDSAASPNWPTTSALGSSLGQSENGAQSTDRYTRDRPLATDKLCATKTRNLWLLSHAQVVQPHRRNALRGVGMSTGSRHTSP